MDNQNLFPMKKLIFILLLIPFAGYSQAKKAVPKKPIEITKYKDDMTDKIYYFTSEKLIVTNQTKTIGFTITGEMEVFQYTDSLNNATIKLEGLAVKLINIGSKCVEDCELIFMFEDATKVNISSSNKFNCDGLAWFILENNSGTYYNDYDYTTNLKTKKIVKIRVVNSRDANELTKDVPQKDQDYFIRLFKGIENYNEKLTTKNN